MVSHLGLQRLVPNYGVDEGAKFVRELLAYDPLYLFYGGDGTRRWPSVITAGNFQPVTQWNDDANGYDVAQAVVANQPQYRQRVAALNNRGGVYFTTDDYLWRALAAGILANLTLYDLFVIYSSTSDIAGFWVCEGNSGDDNPRLTLSINSAGAGTIYGQQKDNSAAVMNINANTSSQDGDPHLVTLRRTAANAWDLRFDGASVDTDAQAIGATTVNRLAIGAMVRTGLQYFFTGHIGLIGAYSTDSYATIEPLAAAHYGVTLP